MFVSDLRHFVDLADDTPRPARRMAEHLLSIVRAATAAEPARRWVSAIPCWRRPGNHPCSGTIAVTRREVPADIEWACTACSDDGVISGWEHSAFDLRADTREPQGSSEDRVVLRLRAEVAATLRTLTLIDTATERLVFTATVGDGHVELRGTDDDFDELADHVAAEANHTVDRRRRKRLDTAFDALRRS